jgi:hypothetical protein
VTPHLLLEAVPRKEGHEVVLDPERREGLEEIHQVAFCPRRVE